MRPVIAIIIILVFAAGCSSVNPRYRRGAQEIGESQTQNRNEDYQLNYQTDQFSGLRTNDLIRLGMIIQSYLGTPYTGHSRFTKGLDCSDFVRSVFRDFNKTDLPRTSKDQFKAGVKMKRAHVRYGDLVFFRTDGKNISHVGIYIGYNEFVHASSSSGVIISGMNEEYWRKRFVGARRVLPQ